MPDRLGGRRNFVRTVELTESAKRLDSGEPPPPRRCTPGDPHVVFERPVLPEVSGDRLKDASSRGEAVDTAMVLSTVPGPQVFTERGE